MQKWEYAVVDVKDGDATVAFGVGFPFPLGYTLQDGLAEVGKEGWELVEVVGPSRTECNLFFKRLRKG